MGFTFQCLLKNCIIIKRVCDGLENECLFLGYSLIHFVDIYSLNHLIF